MVTVIIIFLIVIVFIEFSRHLINSENEKILSEKNLKVEDILKLPKHSKSNRGKYLFLDTETTGLPKKFIEDPRKFENWPYVVELSWVLLDESFNLVSYYNHVLKQSISIPPEATKIHKITNEYMIKNGVSPKESYTKLIEAIDNCTYIIGHNISFDIQILQCELYRNNFEYSLQNKDLICTMNSGGNFIKSINKKHPKLVELFGDLFFNDPFKKIDGAHSALFDTLMTYKCFTKMFDIDKDKLFNTGCQGYPYKNK